MGLKSLSSGFADLVLNGESLDALQSILLQILDLLGCILKSSDSFFDWQGEDFKRWGEIWFNERRSWNGKSPEFIPRRPQLFSQRCDFFQRHWPNT